MTYDLIKCYERSVDFTADDMMCRYMIVFYWNINFYIMFISRISQVALRLTATPSRIL